MSNPSKLSWVIVAGTLWMLAGCDRGARSLHLDKALADASLTTALSGWKQGELPSDLNKKSPRIIMTDVDWSNGMRLVDFELVGDPTDDGTNLHRPVRLSVQDDHGQRMLREVTYIIGTSPSITIFRSE